MCASLWRWSDEIKDGRKSAPSDPQVVCPSCGTRFAQQYPKGYNRFEREAKPRSVDGDQNSKNGAKSGTGKNGSAGGSKANSAAGSKTSKIVIWAVIAVVAVVAGYLALRPASPSDGVTSVSTGGSAAQGSAGVTDVDADGVLKAQQDGVRVIDVRSTGEYAAGHVSGAENVPIDQFAQVSQSWDKSAPVLVYCATGSRSSEAVSILQQAGFAKIYHFSQGLQAWTGELDKATSSAPAPTTAPKPTSKPVMYEFYTDW